MDREYTDRFLSTTISGAIEHSRDPQAVLHAAFNAIGQGDFVAFGESMTDDVELNIHGLGPIDGTWRGRDAVVAATRRNFGLIANQKPEIESLISQGERVVILLRESGIFKSTGESYSVRGVQWFTLTDGKIRKIDEILASI